MISILLADSGCQSFYRHEALDVSDQIRCQQHPGLASRPDWQTSRFLKQQGAALMAKGACFSLSHRLGHAALAISPRTPALGVDLEKIRQRPFAELLPLFARPAEMDWWSLQPHPDEAFYRLWTLKEALFKAQRQTSPLPDGQASANDVPKSLHDLGLTRCSTAPHWQLQAPDERPWWALSLCPAEGWVLACAWVAPAHETCAEPVIRWQTFGKWNAPLPDSSAWSLSSQPCRTTVARI